MLLEKLEKDGSHAVRLLRRSKLEKGLPFMINSKSLSSDQCYMEYPDGAIKVVSANSSYSDFIVLRELDTREAKSLRKKYHLL